MLLPEKTKTNLVFTFQFLNDKIYNHTKTGHLAFGNSSKLVFWWPHSTEIMIYYYLQILTPNSQ